jgi:hypothetical protein
MSIPDEFLIKERFDFPGGGSVEIHDSRFLPTFLEINAKMKREMEEFHNKLMEMNVKAYRCNDGWVDRKNRKVTFFCNENDKGYYWGRKDLEVGDLIFIGDMYSGGRLAKITRCETLWEHNYGWSREYWYEPLGVTVTGIERPYNTEKTLTRKQKILKFIGLFDENKIQTDIFE